jgi:hypothetical protein
MKTLIKSILWGLLITGILIGDYFAVVYGSKILFTLSPTVQVIVLMVCIFVLITFFVYGIFDAEKSDESKE